MAAVQSIPQDDGGVITSPVCFLELMDSADHGFNGILVNARCGNMVAGADRSSVKRTSVNGHCNLVAIQMIVRPPRKPPIHTDEVPNDYGELNKKNRHA